MDFITQTILGAVAGQAAMSKRMGRSAVLFGGAGGLLPDLDVFLTPLADPALPFELHRHFTHSLFFIPVAGALATLPFLLRRVWRANARGVFLTATIGAATHGLLDNLTTYGTHLYWPVYLERTSWDSLSIIDPVFSGVLIIGMLISLIWGSMRPALAAFLVCLAYTGLGVVQHARAQDAQRALAEMRGHEIQSGRVMPTLANFIVFRSVYEHDGRLHADAIRVPPLGEVGVRTGESMPRFQEDDLPEDAPTRVVDVFRRYERFSTDMMGVVRRDPAGGLELGDMRISMVTTGFEPLWGLRIQPEGGVYSVTAAQGFGGERERNVDWLLQRLWDDISDRRGSFVSLDSVNAGRADY